MAVRKPLVLIAGQLAELPAGDTVPGSGGGTGLTLTTVEVSLSTSPRRSGKFTIAGSGLTVGKPVLVTQAVGPYTGKGTSASADECEMDDVSVKAVVRSATEVQCYWNSNTAVRGNFKFNYQVSA